MQQAKQHQELKLLNSINFILQLIFINHQLVKMQYWNRRSSYWSKYVSICEFLAR